MNWLFRILSWCFGRKPKAPDVAPDPNLRGAFARLGFKEPQPDMFDALQPGVVREEFNVWQALEKPIFAVRQVWQTHLSTCPVCQWMADYEAGDVPWDEEQDSDLRAWEHACQSRYDAWCTECPTGHELVNILSTTDMDYENGDDDSAFETLKYLDRDYPAEVEGELVDPRQLL